MRTRRRFEVRVTTPPRERGGFLGDAYLSGYVTAHWPRPGQPLPRAGVHRRLTACLVSRPPALSGFTAEHSGATTLRASITGVRESSSNCFFTSYWTAAILCRLKEPVPLPRICGRELKNRKLDCLVINNLDPAISGQVQTVRGAFKEGGRGFPGRGLKKETHIQVAVSRDPECILGIFRPVVSERFSFVLRHVLAWAGSTIPQAPKERQFIAWGRQPQDPETRQKKPFPAPAGRQARAVAEPSCRPDWGSKQGKGRLGTSWGLRLQAMNFRRYAAGENTDDLQPVNPRLWVACGRCECKPIYRTETR